MHLRYLSCAAVCVAILVSPAMQAVAQSAGDRNEDHLQRKQQDVPTLFQVSTLDALSQGVFAGSYSVGNLRQQGDFGLGTYDGLNGEMVVLDGHYYHAYADGSVKEAANNETAPFAAVTHFIPSATYSVSGLTMAQISTYLTSVLPSANLSYAIKITGTFAAVETRAIPKQSVPYPTLAVASTHESIFDYTQIDGTAVVVRAPAFEKGINVVGDHFHFVSKDHTVAGHALALTTGKVTIQVMPLIQTNLWLPTNAAFLNATLPLN